MYKRRLPWNLLALGAILLLLAARSLSGIWDLSPRQAAGIEARFQASLEEARAKLAEDSLWLGLSQQTFAHPQANSIIGAATAYWLYQEDSLTFWTENQLLLPDSLLGRLQHRQPAFFQENDRAYLLLAHPRPAQQLAVAGIPLDAIAGQAARFQQLPTPYPIRYRDGATAFYAVAIAHSGPWPWLLFALYLLAALGFIRLLGQGGQWVARRWHPLAGLGLALAGAGAVWLGAGAISFHQPAYLQALFSTPAGAGSLAQLSLSTLLLLWLLSFAQRNWPVRPAALPSKAALAMLGYLSIGLFLLIIDGAMESLVRQSGLPFDFKNIFNLSALSLTGIASLVVLLIALLLYSLWIGKGIAGMRLPASRRLLAQGAALAAAVGIAALAALPTSLGLLPFTLMLLLFLALLDLFLDRAQPSLAWLVLWLAVLAAFGTAFLFKYNLDQSRSERLAFAQSLALARDSLAEAELQALGISLQADHLLLQSLMKGDAAAELARALPQYSPYLAKNYQAEAFLPLARQPANPREELAQALFAKVNGTSPLPATQDPRLLPPNHGYYWYALTPALDSQNLLIAFRPTPRRTERILHELLPPGVTQRYPFDYLVYFQGMALPQRGQFERHWLAPANWPQGEAWKERLSSQLALLYYQPAPEAYGIVVKEDLGGYIKPLSLFSYLFALLMTASVALLELNRRRRFFPFTAGLAFWGTPSLRHRIQFAIIGLSLGAFLLIGLITVSYFQNLFAANHQEQLFDMVGKLARNLQQQGIQADADGQLAPLAELYQADLSLFSLTDGQLHASSAPFLFEQGYYAPRIRPEVLAAFRQNNFKPMVLREQAGRLPFLAAYLALPGSDGKMAWALQIPYTAGDRRLQQQVVEFIGALLNLYVFLLLIAGALAIAVANSIARPLMAIGEKLRSFQLGKNEPLQWDSQDEIGRLVAEYNHMAAKLEESTAKLRQSEREGAWREMAKQVAHEIKNPLTPMKLSIQYLQQVQRSDPDRARSMIERVAKTLVEQIDGLARIASAFSDFAKMPQAQNETLALNEIATSVYNLFAGQQELQTRFSLQLPTDSLLVFADKNQLIRVLNNLVKNALQAIPEDRSGLISLELQRQRQLALLAVRDNGAGIPEALRDKVFQPNFTTKSSGMGLGLAMCRDIVEMAGGQLYFETVEGQGTAFFMALPLIGDGELNAP